ncbi:MAG: hypothetical protein HRU25_03990 [Psychrobium sp.]|nr:hypothetical protein [Psychrobium sp.]
MYKPTEQELELLKRWYAPEMSEKVAKEKTNAFGMSVSQVGKTKPKPVEKQVEDISDTIEQPQALSAAQLAEISDQAQEQGFEQGLKKGTEQGLLEGHTLGFDQGLEQGNEEGLKQGLAQSEIEINARFALLDALIAQLQHPLKAQEEALEESLLTLALTLAKKVIHTEISQSPLPIISAISEGIRALDNNETLKIRLHQQDLQHVSDYWSKDELAKRQIHLEHDVTLQPGDCHIESKVSSVNLPLSDRIEQVFDDLLGQEKPKTTVTAEPQLTLPLADSPSGETSLSGSATDEQPTVADPQRLNDDE